ncbi:sperm-tail PG-rich repeat-containing protein 2 isoform X2 [Hydra vulgaris]|uniref:Sperm-tail PG-rich repeat-containing protein 2 isoform X2 n=1 Tax=Hydra vulgaris TaxID=6087 RepID=A0ABM4D1X7_HYDVU
MYDRATRVLTQAATGTPASVGPGSYFNQNNILFHKFDSYAPFLSVSLRESFLTIPESVAEIPGPGNYNPKLLTSIKGGSTLQNKTSRFTELNDELPGPGSYNINSEWLSKQTQLDFGKSRNNSKNSNINFLHKKVPPSIPSPGQANGYEQNIDGSLHKKEASNHDITLGPAFYKINFEETAPVKKYRGIHFGKMTSRRTDFKGNDGPGPGNYDPYKYKLANEWTLEREKKRVNSKLPRYHEIIALEENKKAFPGPGQYELPSQFQKEKISENASTPPFGSKAKRFLESKDISPAPGSYDDPRHAFENSSWSIGSKSPFGHTATRFLSDYYASSSPGPGSYCYDSMSAMSKRKALFVNIKKVGFGSSVNRELALSKKEDSLLPGPSNYLPKSPQILFPNKNHAVFKSTTPRLISCTKDETLPFVSYESDKMDTHPYKKLIEQRKHPGCGFLSSAERFHDSFLMTADLDNPGPGQYDMKQHSAPGGNLVSKEVRFKSVICDVPGPGTYQLSPLLKHTLMRSTFNATLSNPVAMLSEEAILKTVQPTLTLSVVN